MKKHGFYCRMYGKDCFLETSQIKRTNKLAEDFILSVQFRLGWQRRFADDITVAIVKSAMSTATFEIKTIESGSFKGLKYYEINGENFSYGCDGCENPLEKLIVISYT